MPPAPAGIPLLAPSLESDDSGYQQDYFGQIRALEDRSFWFRARNALIQWAVSRYFPNSESFLEVGCGTGFVLEGLRTRFPRLRLTGSELSSRGLALAAARVQGAEFLQMDARSIPFNSHFDAIGAFDVLEHIHEDEAVLREIHRALRPGGGLIVTVPQHPFLWSEVDVFARHVRRYRRLELREKLKRSGFEPLRITSFVSLLLPLLIMSRLFRRKTFESDAGEPELSLPSWVDGILGTAMGLERGLIRAGISFPAGGSLLVVARRVGGNA